MSVLSRRSFLKGLILTAAGLAIPASALPDVEPQRQLWALDRSMLVTAATLGEAERFAEAAGRALASMREAALAFERLGMLAPPSPGAIDVFLADTRGGMGRRYNVATRRGWRDG